MCIFFYSTILSSRLATLLEGAGYLIFSSAITFKTFNILWCFGAVKLDFITKNVYVSASGVINVWILRTL